MGLFFRLSVGVDLLADDVFEVWELLEGYGVEELSEIEDGVGMEEGLKGVVYEVGL